MLPAAPHFCVQWGITHTLPRTLITIQNQCGKMAQLEEVINRKMVMEEKGGDRKIGSIYTYIYTFLEVVSIVQLYCYCIKKSCLKTGFTMIKENVNSLTVSISCNVPSDCNFFIFLFTFAYTHTQMVIQKIYSYY